MSRRSPRSRSRQPPERRIPAKARTRATPGSKRRSTKASPSKAGAHPRRAARGAVTLSRPGRRRARFTPPDPASIRGMIEILGRAHPGAKCALDFSTPFQLLVATILSAQCTDARVNLTTPALFARYPDPASMAAAVPAELEAMIRSTGFYRNKARALRECSADIVALHGGEVPSTMEELTRLRGVGRKTANVVLGNAYGIPGVVVDTHVWRLAHRLGLTREKDPVKIEFELMSLIPEERWTIFSHWLILHGRQVCVARKPRCSICPLTPHCPRVGVTASA